MAVWVRQRSGRREPARASSRTAGMAACGLGRLSRPLAFSTPRHGVHGWRSDSPPLCEKKPDRLVGHGGSRQALSVAASGVRLASRPLPDTAQEPRFRFQSKPATSSWTRRSRPSQVIASPLAKLAAERRRQGGAIARVTVPRSPSWLGINDARGRGPPACQLRAPSRQP